MVVKENPDRKKKKKRKRNTNPLTHQNYAIYVLDDYSVHNQLQVKRALSLGMGGAVIGDLQVNDTDLNGPLKREYCE